MILCVIPMPESTSRFDWLPVPIDKVVHFTFYFVLASLLFRWLQHQGKSRIVVTFSSLISLVSTVLYGMLIEFIQLYIPYRSGDWHDVAANATGSLIGIMFMKNLYKKAVKKEN